jgi:hypothetical protein
VLEKLLNELLNGGIVVELCTKLPIHEIESGSEA